jgi:hypothetical protein
VHRVCPGSRLFRGWASEKKTDVVEHPKVANHIGLLVNEPPGIAELPFS